MIVDDRWTAIVAAKMFMVSPVTARKWAARYRAEGIAGMGDRSSPIYGASRASLLQVPFFCEPRTVHVARELLAHRRLGSQSMTDRGSPTDRLLRSSLRGPSAGAAIVYVHQPIMRSSRRRGRPSFVGRPTQSATLW
ncbi:leucine zipper domain-containing protein [Microbacterium sp. MYb43]|uniref:leucine zipper domain-containing protein n=1 Tax=unclassified Microbacterium TaxID=2609290 RepID=UPI0035BE419D